MIIAGCVLNFLAKDLIRVSVNGAESIISCSSSFVSVHLMAKISASSSLFLSKSK